LIGTSNVEPIGLLELAQYPALLATMLSYCSMIGSL